MYRIMIVEDDPVIAGAMEHHITGWGHEVHVAKQFRDILPEFEAFSPHLLLMDISLPFYDGYHWCREIRKTSQIPVIFISSAGDNLNIIMAMNMGGDDFIAKPFDLTVLMAKIQALLRRTYDFSQGTGTLEARGAVLSPDASLRFGGNRLDLSKNEYRILEALMEQQGRVVSREALMQKLWETDSYVDENTLTVNITRLRRKLSSIGLENLIATKKGMGYLIPKEET